MIDWTGGGTIDRNEFLQCLHHLGHTTIAYQDANAIFDTLDLNRNGDISLDEFVACYTLNF
jgi:Ca2+-binding EF-hand superfamily protein